MNAAIYHQFGGPIRVQKVPVPDLPTDGILIRVLATGICRSDWHGWKGHDSDIKDHGLPLCPGHEVSGVVVAVGSDCVKFVPGDRVAVPFILSCGVCKYCLDEKSTVCINQKQPGFTQFGAFAEYLALPRADRNVKHLPNGVSFVQAAALGCRFTTAYRAVVQQGRMSDSIAIFGCGGVGLSCIMIAATAGATKIIAIDINKDALRKAMELGATHTVLSTANSDQVCREVMDLTNGDGVPLTIDAAGVASTCENAVRCTSRGGRMVQVGLPIGKNQPKVPMGLVASRELEIIGSHGFAAEDLPILLNLVASKRLHPGRLVEKEVSLAEGALILEDMDYCSPLGITMITRFQNDSRL
jgi:alcohol dehydrogenase